MKGYAQAILLAAIISWLGPDNYAATVLVPDDQPTIQAAIDATDGEDTVLVSDGAYSGTGFYDLLIPDTTIVIRSMNGSSVTTIDCEGPEPGNHVAFKLGQGALGTGRNTSVTIEGFTIINGIGGAYGGAITGDSWHLIIRDCVFRSNRATDGGAIACVDCQGEIFSSRFLRNVADDSGGAIYGFDEAYIYNTRFDSNMADVGGALGGTDTLVVESSVLHGNSAYTGSALHPNPAINSYTYMSGCIVTRNVQSPAFYMPPSSNAEFWDCTIYGNKGVFELHNANVTLTDCIITSNADKTVICFDDVSGEDSDPYFTYCCVDDSATDLSGCNASFILMPNNLIADPLFCDSANNDFRIGSTSPCVGTASDGGNIGAVGVGCSPTDVDDDEDPLLPDGFALMQNYPNPFNAGTVIAYELPRVSAVTLSIYAIDGRLVRRMVFEAQAAGRHRVEWDGTSGNGSSVASGVYVYRLEAGDFAATRKMLLVK